MYSWLRSTWLNSATGGVLHFHRSHKRVEQVILDGICADSLGDWWYLDPTGVHPACYKETTNSARMQLFV